MRGKLTCRFRGRFGKTFITESLTKLDSNFKGGRIFISLFEIHGVFQKFL